MKDLRSDLVKMELDALSDESVRRALKTLIDREGTIDIVVNNAGAYSIRDGPRNSLTSCMDHSLTSQSTPCNAPSTLMSLLFFESRRRSLHLWLSTSPALS
jgi:NAD(P)-dependent dehydrogenase (short-subunit alcohol dehydrogenase family)